MIAKYLNAAHYCPYAELRGATLSFSTAILFFFKSITNPKNDVDKCQN